MGKAPKDIIRIMAAECDVPGLLATVDALQSRLAAAEGAAVQARALLAGVALTLRDVARGRTTFAECERDADRIDAHLAPAPTKPEGGEAADGR